MSSGRTEASLALRRRARERIRDARARGQRLADAWQAASDRKFAELDELADSVLAAEESSGSELATDLFSVWIGSWADAIDLLHTACNICLNPPSDGPVGITDPTPVVSFEIQAVAQAADPLVVPGVALGDAPKISPTALQTQGPSPATIPVENVRVTTYGSRVLVSLVSLGGLNLAAGVYTGSLRLGDKTVAKVPVTVTSSVGVPSS
jgi:hypothetical protein